MSFGIDVLVNQKALHLSTESFTLDKFCLGSHMLESPGKIYGISITKDLVIIITEEWSPAGEWAPGKSMLPNNINAYDWDGNHLWNIADIVGDLGVPFYGGTVTTKDVVKDDLESDELKYDDSCELFCCHASDNHLYIIDLNCRKLLKVLETK